MASITIGSVTIDRGIEHTSKFAIRRVNQYTQQTSAGELITFDNSVSVVEGIIRIRFISKSKADEIRNFIANSIRFQRFQFTITPSSFDDVGAGVGVALTDCNYNGGPSTDGVVEPFGKANKFNLIFPYRAIIQPGAGTADQAGNLA